MWELVKYAEEQGIGFGIDVEVLNKAVRDGSMGQLTISAMHTVTAYSDINVSKPAILNG